MEGWQSLPFEECIEQVVYTAKVQRKDFLAEGAYPIVSQEEAFTNGFWDQEVDIFRVDRPLVVFGDHTRILKYIDFDFVLGADGVKVLKPKSFLHPRFFYYQLHTAKLDSLGYARHYRLLKQHHVAYPAYAEQQRITAILDEAFEGISTAKANAEKNLQNASELFGAYLQAVFSGTKNLVPLCDLASDITDGDHMPPPKAKTGIPFITISNIVKRTRTVDFEDTFLVSPEYFSRLKPNRRPQRGDVLYTVTGATLGIPVLVDNDKDFCFQRHIALIRPNPEINSAWLNYVMSSPQVFAQATAGATGAAQKTVSLTLLRSIKVPRHSQLEQISITARLDELFARICKLEDFYSARISALEELKKSLLHQAFTGQL